MKKTLTLIALIVGAVSSYARDFSYTYENQTITYTVLDEDAKTCETQHGYSSAPYSVNGDLILPEHPIFGGTQYTLIKIGKCSFDGTDITSVIIPNSVETIDYSAFRNCNSLTSAKIGESVISIGDAAFRDCSKLTEILIPDKTTTIGENAFENCASIKKIYLGEHLDDIGDSAFKGCLGLTEVTIPESVTYIGPQAFHGCDNLETVYFNAVNCEYCGPTGAGIGNYYAKSSFPPTIKKAVIGNKVKTIPPSAFCKCGELTEINIPASVESIDVMAFYECNNLQAVNVESLESWVKIVFYWEDSNPLYYAKKLFIDGQWIRKLVIPEGVERINTFAFYRCDLLTVTLPSSLKSIGNEAFYGCSALQRDIFPSLESFLSVNYDSWEAHFTNGNSSKIYIGSELFDHQTVEYINIPETMTRIPDYAFYKYKNLKEVIIPKSVTEIGKYAFGYCSKLNMDLVISDAVSSIGEYAFASCESLKSLTLGNSLTKILNGTFFECGFTSIDLGNSVNFIGARAFKNCRNITRVVIPNSVETIGYSAFYYCSNLSEITIPKSVKEIGTYAFEEDYELKNVHIEDIKSWAQIEFGNQLSNPIYYSNQFSIGESDKIVKHLDLDLGDNSISAHAFPYALNIETARIKAKSIGQAAFWLCMNLKHLCLETSALGSDAFTYNTAMETIYSMTPEPPVAPDNAFEKKENVKLYVPKGSLSKYENAPTCWWQFLDVYESDFEDLDKIFNPEMSGVSEITVDEQEYPVEVYNLNGVKVGNSTDGLTKGLYIVRKGGVASKVIVK